MQYLFPSEILPQPADDENQIPAHPIGGIVFVLFLGIAALLAMEWASQPVTSLLSTVSIQDLPRILLGR
ncbi:MAG: hypothetical protein KDA84_21625 [Planctomycetaceae bacterium]|nr:hypothetical protein [Planctomycetaceae bacterium]